MARLKSKLPILMGKWEVENDKRLTQRKLSEATGISRDAIGRLYKGEITRFDETTILALCKFFKCDIGDLLEVQYEPGELTS
jgi:DNA-binding Xre family transcriptional regulator